MIGGELSRGADRELVNVQTDMNRRDIDCEGGRWIELAHHRVQCLTLVLAVLNVRVLLRVFGK